MATTPSFSNFLKEGLLLPTHNPRLFASVFAIIVTSSSLLLLGIHLATQPLVDEFRMDSNALKSTNPRSPEFIHLLQEVKNDTRALLISSAVCLLVVSVVGYFIRIVVLFAAITTYSGERHTFASLLGKVKAHLKGPLLTLGFIYVLEITYLTLIAAMVWLYFFLKIKQYLTLLFVDSLLIIVAFIFFIYFSFIWSLSLVIAVAEPGCHGAGAVGRAWRIMKGKLMRAVLLILVTVLLHVAIRPVHTLAKMCALTNIASGLLLGFLYTILMGAVGLFSTCAMTAFYYECKGCTEALAMEYSMVSTKDQTNVSLCFPRGI